jgi:hypothetical protein
VEQSSRATRAYDGTVLYKPHCQLCDFVAISQGFLCVLASLEDKLLFEIGEVLWTEDGE